MSCSLQCTSCFCRQTAALTRTGQGFIGSSGETNIFKHLSQYKSKSKSEVQLKSQIQIYSLNYSFSEL